jgi:hypothetical protein
MKASALDHSHADRRGMLLASLCFVHCVAGPLLLSFAGLSSLIGVSEKLEPLFLLGSAAMGVIAFVPAYRKKHRRKSCLTLFAVGFFCLLLRRRIELPAIPGELLGTALGAGLIIGAHVLNLIFSKRCQCCDPLSQADAPAEFSASPIRVRKT